MQPVFTLICKKCIEIKVINIKLLKNVFSIIL